ncbi:aspartate carbamoyltransferase [candidate division WOR-3 bacterium JGI_Cruoil_03_51_56]|uniref:Aspartate carbamoyltransferase n=1 Tax=candidate division WOR-3 bacterium JGI_Cruoil_03_51_56 TaxID=1973747 RepID=A0A235BV93_UNCW3|nr:MAG: aspartate carbamoyltransferase [candidate division WOR-3 bacterium JGI_Cruoil_03_51_56]
MKPRFKHLLGIELLTRSDIIGILDQTESFLEVLKRPIPVVPALRGKTIVNLFFEPSTRTALSFSLAASRLSAHCVNFSFPSSSVQKGETLLDTARNIEAMRVDGVVVRHSMPGAPHFLARRLKAFVVNAGDGCHEHPTQALLDAFTLRQHLGSLKGKRILFVGDIAHSRVARSNIICFSKLGARVAVCGPPTFLPTDIEKLGCEVFYRLDKILYEVDVVNMLRVQNERTDLSLFPSIREYRALYGLTRERLSKLDKSVLVIHPGPVNWGVEMDFEIAEFPQTLILNQVTNGVAVRMAVLYLLAGGHEET